MLSEMRWSVESPWAQGQLRAFEPTLAEVQAAAPLLAGFYNDSHNSAMMTNTHEMSIAEVVESFQSMWAAGDRPFLLERDGELMGDADFRNTAGTAAEFAILVGHRALQSRGLGTRYAAMLHALGLRVMGLERVYGVVIPQNIASRRMLEKLGYQVDFSPLAVAYAEADDDVVMSVSRDQFEHAYAELLTQLIIAPREE